MRRILTERFTAIGRHSVFRNFLSLSVLQLVALGTPLLTMPLVIRIAGLEKFGVIGMAMALVAWFELLTDYGFDLSATRQVSVNRSDSASLQRIFSSVTTIRLITSTGGLVMLIGLTSAIPVLREHRWIYLITYGRVFGKSLFPIWFYQGMEEMRFITVFQAGSRICFAALTFLLFRKPEDLALVPGLQSLGMIVPAAVALYHVKRKFGIRFIWPGAQAMKESLQDGFHIFLSRVYVNMYHSFNTLILGFMSGYTAVGQYVMSAKVIEACSMIFIPANNALFPHLSRLWKEDPGGFSVLTNRLQKGFLTAGTILAVTVLLLNGPIIILLNGSFEADAIRLLNILAFKLPFIALGPLYTSILIGQGRNKDYLWVVRNTLVINIILVPLSIGLYGATGLAVATLMVTAAHQWLFMQKGAPAIIPVRITRTLE